VYTPSELARLKLFIEDSKKTPLSWFPEVLASFWWSKTSAAYGKLWLEQQKFQSSIGCA
jgi:hypothetical protein